MRRMLWVLLGIMVVLPLHFAVAPAWDRERAPVAFAQETDPVATPPADTATPPDNVETSTPINWGLVGLLAVLILLGIIIGTYLDRRNRQAQARRSAQRIELDQPPPDESARR